MTPSRHASFPFLLPPTQGNSQLSIPLYHNSSSVEQIDEDNCRPELSFEQPSYLNTSILSTESTMSGKGKASSSSSSGSTSANGSHNSSSSADSDGFGSNKGYYPAAYGGSSWSSSGGKAYESSKGRSSTYYDSLRPKGSYERLRRSR